MGCQSVFRDFVDYTQKDMHCSSVIWIVCVTISFSMGSDTIDLTQDFLQNTLDSLNEVDQNQHRNESTSGSVVIKTFKNAIKTLIEESKNSVRPKLEFIDKVDKKQSINKVKNATSGNWDFTIGKWNITGNWNSSTGGYWNSNPGNNTLTRIFETVFDEDFGDYDDFETMFGEAIPKIDELIDGPLVPFFCYWFDFGYGNVCPSIPNDDFNDDIHTIFDDIYNSLLNDGPNYGTIFVSIRRCVIFTNLLCRKISLITR